MAIKAIIFDCFGVLVTSARNALVGEYPQFRTQIDDIAHQSDYGLISRQQFIDSLADILGMTSHDADSLYSNVTVRDEKAINWVKELKKSKKYKIGMLSNVGPGFVNKLFSPTDQKEMFDEIVLSYNVGIAKPEIAIFELVAKKLGVKMSECVMIDDTEQNISAATSADMIGIRFIDINQAQDELSRLLESDRA